MKNVISIGILAFSGLLAGCGDKSAPSASSATPPNDAVIRQKIVGSWKVDADPAELLIINPDGSVVDKGGDLHGTWKVTNGLFMVTETNKDGSEPDTETGKVVRIDDHEMVLQDSEGPDKVTFHKK